MVSRQKKVINITLAIEINENWFAQYHIYNGY